MSAFKSTKIIPMGSTAFRQWRAGSHCKFIHGYRLQTKLWFGLSEGATLDDKNWVFDFGGCKEIKKLLEDQFDHTFCAAADDPELETFQQLDASGLIQLRVMDGVGIEKTAEWVYKAVSKYVKESTNGRVKIDKVEVWEHEGNSAIYDTRLDAINSKSERYIDQRILNKEKAHEIALKENSEKELETSEEVKEQTPEEKGPDLYPPKTTGKSDWFKGTSWGGLV